MSEIQVVWQVAVLLKSKLEKLGFKVVMTKSKENQYVKNRARAETANNAHADYMVRLHCDASSGSGFASYYPATTGTSQGFTGPSKAVIRASASKAKVFHAALSKGLKGLLKDNGLKTDRQTAVGAQHGALIGSIFSKVPVVLVEMVVLTNRKDETFIESKGGQEAMANALAAGVVAAVRS